MFLSPPPRSRAVRVADLVFLLLGLALLILFTTRYQMPFRLDDVLHMDWAREHSLLDAFHPVEGEIVRSVRPLFAVTIWILTHTAGTDSYLAWHVTLVLSFLIGLTFAGLTARYIAQRTAALYITTTIFWIGFLSILNVLFWFGDLTFTIELMFVGASWYYGLRGLCEARIGFWILGCLLGMCAVLSKEPAIILVHTVFAGAVVFYFRELALEWKHKSKFVAIAIYLAFLAVSVWMIAVSPTKSNRFFALSHESLEFFIADRLGYYGMILSPSFVRILLFLPLHILLLDGIRQVLRGKKLTLYLTILFVTFILAAGSSNPLFVLAYYIVVPILAYYLRSFGQDRYLLLLPFSVCMTLIFLALLITVMLVKTQLIEFAFCAIVVSGSAWAIVCTAIWQRYQRHRSRASDRGLGLIAAGGIAALLFLMAPKIAQKEALLRDVQATRLNANEAIKWMARELPKGSTVLVTGPQLYGTKNENDLTGLDDETKLFAQYTFIQGYVRIYFQQLNRPDLRIAYLEDSTMLYKVLPAVRAEPAHYLFLQTGRDHQRFHSSIDGRKPLQPGDSLVSSFQRGNFHAEVWKLRTQ